MTAVGKTSIGRNLAEHLRVPFFDGDAEVQRVTCRAARDVIASDGMEAFRALEEQVTLDLLQAGQAGQAVVALGGGPWLTPSVRAAALSSAVTVWLDADAELLYHRAAEAGRVLAQRGRAAFLEEARAREQVYREADIVVRIADEPVETSVQRVISALTAAGENVGDSREAPRGRDASRQDRPAEDSRRP